MSEETVDTNYDRSLVSAVFEGLHHCNDRATLGGTDTGNSSAGVKDVSSVVGHALSARRGSSSSSLRQRSHSLLLGGGSAVQFEENYHLPTVTSPRSARHNAQQFHSKPDSVSMSDHFVLGLGGDHSFHSKLRDQGDWLYKHMIIRMQHALEAEALSRRRRLSHLRSLSFEFDHRVHDLTDHCIAESVLREENARHVRRTHTRNVNRFCLSLLAEYRKRLSAIPSQVRLLSIVRPLQRLDLYEQYRWERWLQRVAEDAQRALEFVDVPLHSTEASTRAKYLSEYSQELRCILERENIISQHTDVLISRIADIRWKVTDVQHKDSQDSQHFQIGDSFLHPVRKALRIYSDAPMQEVQGQSPKPGKPRVTMVAKEHCAPTTQLLNGVVSAYNIPKAGEAATASGADSPQRQLRSKHAYHRRFPQHTLHYAGLRLHQPLSSVSIEWCSETDLYLCADTRIYYCAEERSLSCLVPDTSDRRSVANGIRPTGWPLDKAVWIAENAPDLVAGSHMLVTFPPLSDVDPFIVHTLIENERDRIEHPLLRSNTSKATDAKMLVYARAGRAAGGVDVLHSRSDLHRTSLCFVQANVQHLLECFRFFESGLGKNDMAELGKQYLMSHRPLLRNLYTHEYSLVDPNYHRLRRLTDSEIDELITVYVVRDSFGAKNASHITPSATSVSDANAPTATLNEFPRRHTDVRSDQPELTIDDVTKDSNIQRQLKDLHAHGGSSFSVPSASSAPASPGFFHVNPWVGDSALKEVTPVTSPTKIQGGMNVGGNDAETMAALQSRPAYAYAVLYTVAPRLEADLLIQFSIRERKSVSSSTDADGGDATSSTEAKAARHLRQRIERAMESICAVSGCLALVPKDDDAGNHAASDDGGDHSYDSLLCPRHRVLRRILTANGVSTKCFSSANLVSELPLRPEDLVVEDELDIHGVTELVDQLLRRQDAATWAAKAIDSTVDKISTEFQSLAADASMQLSRCNRTEPPSQPSESRQRRVAARSKTRTSKRLLRTRSRKGSRSAASDASSRASIDDARALNTAPVELLTATAYEGVRPSTPFQRVYGTLYAHRQSAWQRVECSAASSPVKAVHDAAEDASRQMKDELQKVHEVIAFERQQMRDTAAQYASVHAVERANTEMLQAALRSLSTGEVAGADRAALVQELYRVMGDALESYIDREDTDSAVDRALAPGSTDRKARNDADGVETSMSMRDRMRLMQSRNEAMEKRELLQRMQSDSAM